ncbi:MAG TPA: hypothetical protein ENN99_01235 [Chloroflexi bacterium]|mgnify:CR=1 FL=1|nr:hypothetical protein [Chloroflexota bacterium]
MNRQTLPMIEVRGSPYERGKQQGEKARPQIQKALAGYRETIPQALKMTWEEAAREARKFLPYGEEAFPDFVLELEGIAEGGGVSFEDVWSLNCYEGLVDTRQQVWGCTSLAVRDDQTADGHVLLAHNEDWSSVDRGNVYLVCAEPDGGPSFIGMTYGPLLVNIGFNAEGIGVTINSAHSTDGRVGVPRILYSRAILQARTIGEAIAACVPKLRAGGYSYLVADSNGELYNVEASATTHDIMYGRDGWLIHTNHYLSPKMQDLEEPDVHIGSIIRFHRAERLLRSRLGQVTKGCLQGVLQDHINWPYSICMHEDPARPPHQRGLTLASLVMDLTEHTIQVAAGPPCQAEYVTYCL